MPENPPHTPARRDALLLADGRDTLLAAAGAAPGPGAGRWPARARWVAVDLRAECEVRSVAVEEPSEPSGATVRAGVVAGCEVETSLDGIEWRRVGAVPAGAGAVTRGGGGRGAPALVLDEPVAARWVRLTPASGSGTGAGPRRSGLGGFLVYGRCAHERPPAVVWTAHAGGGAPDSGPGEAGATGSADLAARWTDRAAPEHPAGEDRGGVWEFGGEWELVLDDRAGVVDGAALTGLARSGPGTSGRTGSGAARPRRANGTDAPAAEDNGAGLAESAPADRHLAGDGFADAHVPASAPGTVLAARLEQARLPDPAAGTDGLDPAEVAGAGPRHSWWYRRPFALPATAGPDAGARWWLEVEGLGHEAEVWLNGRPAGALPHPFARAAFDVTAAVREGRLQTLAVRLAPEPHLGGPAAAGAAFFPDAPGRRDAAVLTAPALGARLAPALRLRHAPSASGHPLTAPETFTAPEPFDALEPFDAFTALDPFGGPATVLLPSPAGLRAWGPGGRARDAVPEPMAGVAHGAYPGRVSAAFARAVEERVGPVDGGGPAPGFLRGARLVDYENLRAVVENAAARPWRHPAPASSGLTASSAATDAGAYALRKAGGPLHVQADPRDGAVLVVNRTRGALRAVVVTAWLYDLGGRPLDAAERTVDVAACGTAYAFAVPFGRSLPAAHLLRLRLSDEAGRTLCVNEYGRYRTPADMRALGGLPFVGLSLDLRYAGPGPRPEPGPGPASARVTNLGAAPAASVRLSVAGGDASGPADNFFWLLPGESREVALARRGASGRGGRVTAEAYNALPVTV